MDTSFITVNTHSSIRLQTSRGTVIYVDPFGFETEPHDADLILITHTHYDHFSPDDIAKVRMTHTVFVMPATSMGEFIKAGFTNEAAAFLVPYEKAMPLPGIEIETVPAYNISKGFHPEDNAWMGYIVDIDDTLVYIAGDTDDLPENRTIKCDIALVPVGGTYTMNVSEAAAFVNALKPTVAIPEHYGTIVGSTDDGARFAELVDPDIQVVLKL